MDGFWIGLGIFMGCLMLDNGLTNIAKAIAKWKP